MRTARVLIGVVGAAVLALGAPATAQNTLPEGPNRDFVARTCGSCHDIGMVLGASGRSRAGWDGTIDEMTGYGLQVTPDERKLLLDYLTTYLGRE
jgi:cytochrome c5